MGAKNYISRKAAKGAKVMGLRPSSRAMRGIYERFLPSIEMTRRVLGVPLAQLRTGLARKHFLSLQLGA